MNANRFYSIPFDARNDPAIKKLRRKHGGLVAFGRYQALLGILYDQDNAIHLSDEDDLILVLEELEMDEKELTAFLNSCAKFDLIDCDKFCQDYPVIASVGVQKELDYRKKKEVAGTKGGKKSGAVRKAKSEAKKEAAIEAEGEAND